MKKIIVQSTAFRLLLIGCLFQLSVYGLLARETQSLTNNIHHTKQDNQITIQYDLKGAVTSSYQVSLVMLNKDNGLFHYVPKNIQGDVGSDIIAGESKTITWDTKSEFPNGLEGSGYYFAVQAVEDTSTSISPWVWVGGAVVVGGVVLLLTKKTQDEGPNVFPEPPGRP